MVERKSYGKKVQKVVKRAHKLMYKAHAELESLGPLGYRTIAQERVMALALHLNEAMDQAVYIYSTPVELLDAVEEIR